MKYQELNKQIKAGDFAKIYVFSGVETHIAAMMEERLIGAAVAPGLEQINVAVYDDKETAAGEIIESARQLPVMSPYRVVIVREQAGILTRSDAETEALFTAYFNKPEPQTILLLHAAKIDKRRKLGKALLAAATEVRFDKLSEDELTKWIVRRLDQSGKSVSRRGVRAIIDKTMYLYHEDMNTAIIDGELGKLIDYAGNDKRVTLESIEEILPESVDDNVYHMIDAAVAGRTDAALKMLEQFYLKGEEPIRLFGLIVSQFRVMTQIAFLTESGGSQSAIAKSVRRPAFVVRKMMPAARKLGAAALSDMMISLAKWDYDMKTGAVDAALSVELWLIRLSR